MLNLLLFNEKKTPTNKPNPKLLLASFFLHTIFVPKYPIGDIAVSVNTVHGLAPGLCLFRV